jgi:hypothetical protein
LQVDYEYVEFLLRLGGVLDLSSDAALEKLHHVFFGRSSTKHLIQAGGSEARQYIR